VRNVIVPNIGNEKENINFNWHHGLESERLEFEIFT